MSFEQALRELLHRERVGVVGLGGARVLELLLPLGVAAGLRLQVLQLVGDLGAVDLHALLGCLGLDDDPLEQDLDGLLLEQLVRRRSPSVHPAAAP